MSDDVGAQALRTAVLYIILQPDVRGMILRGLAAQRLREAHATMALRIRAINGLWPIIRHDALIGTGDIATRRVVHPRHLVVRNITLPLIGGRTGITEAGHNAAADRNASGHLIADMPVHIGVDEIEDRNCPVAQRRAKTSPVLCPSYRHGGSDIVHVLHADPAQR